MKAGRLAWLTPAELDPEQRLLYDAITGGRRADGEQAFALTDDSGRLHGPFNAMLMSPNIGTALQALGTAIRFRTTFSDREREIAILELAAVRRSEFEWYAHSRVGRLAGLSTEELHALRHSTEAASLSARETLVRIIVRKLAIERDLSSAAYERAERDLGAAQLADLIALVGYYDLLALSLRVNRTPLPSDAAPVFNDRQAD